MKTPILSKEQRIAIIEEQLPDNSLGLLFAWVLDDANDNDNALGLVENAMPYLILCSKGIRLLEKIHAFFVGYPYKNAAWTANMIIGYSRSISEILEQAKKDKRPAQTQSNSE